MLHLRILLIIALIATISFQGSAEVIWQRDFERAKQIAQEEQKFMLVDFWAWWCGPCKKMDSEVWSQDGITQLAHKFIPVKVDLDADKSTSNAYRVSAIPTMMILDPYGEVVWQSTGYMGFDQVQDLLTTFPSDASFIAESTAKIKADDKDQKAYLNWKAWPTNPIFQKAINTFQTLLSMPERQMMASLRRKLKSWK